MVINVTEKLNNHKGNTENPRSSWQDPFWKLWRLIWFSGAACTALDRFFRVGRSCIVPDFIGFSRVVQSAGQAFCVEILALSENVRCVAVCGYCPFSFLVGAVFVGGLLRLFLRVACVVGVAVREGQAVCCCAFVRSGNRWGVRRQELR